MFIRRYRISMTTDGSSAFTGYTDEPVNGEIRQIQYTKNDFTDGGTFTLTGKDTAIPIWAEANVNATARRVPRQASHLNTTGAAATLDGTRPALVPIVVSGERLQLVITGTPGAGKTGLVDIWVG